MYSSSYIRLPTSTVFICFILLNIIQPLNLFINVSAQSLDFELVGYGWRTPSDPERVYPGSSKVSYYVSLMYTGGSRVSKLYAELYLPRGITTFSEGFNVVYSEFDVTVDKYDTITLDFPNLNISYSLKPGVYKAELRFTYIVAGGISYTDTIYVPMVVNGLPQQPLEIVDYFWATKDGLRRTVVPGLRDLDVVFYFRVKDDVVIRNIYATLHLPEGFSCGGLQNSTSVAQNLRYVNGDLIELRFSSINVDEELLTNVFNLTLHINSQLDLYGLTANVTQAFSVTSHISYDGIRVLDLVSYYWGDSEPIPVYPNTSKASISITLVNVGVDSIYGLIGRLYLPNGFKHIYGGRLVNSSYASRLSPGSTATLVFSEIYLESNISPGEYLLKLTVEYFVDLGGSSLRVIQEFNITMNVLNPDDPISVVGIRWNNNYGVAFPGSREELEVILSNWDEYSIDLVEPNAYLPGGLNLLSVGGDCFNGIAPYSTCSLRLVINIPNDVKPGQYELSIYLKYLIRVGSSDILRYRSFTHRLKVWDPEIVGAKLITTTAFWGDPANPREALPGNKLIPLNIELVNVGRDVATGVVADIELPQGFKLSYPEGRASCNIVDRGGSCLLRYQVDIDPSLKPGTYTAKLVVRYVTYFNSANLSKLDSFNINVSVSEYPRELRLHIVEVNWSNNLPAYPGDEALLTVRAANLGPHAMFSITSKLSLPEGFTCEDERVCEHYFPGPLQQYQQFNSSFRISISRGVKPGIYLGGLTFEYIAQTGGYGIRLINTYVIKIRVSDLSNSIKLVGVYWVNTTPSKGDVGLMRVVLRCDEIPNLSGMVLKFHLPDGIVALPNNSSIISIPYYQQLQFVGIPYIGGLPPQLITQGGTAKGDMVYVDLPVRFLELPQDPTINIIVEFLDHWGSLQEVRMKTTIPLLGKSRVLAVEPIENVITAGRMVSEIKFKFTNLGDSQIYNLVVYALSPYAGISIADPVKFVDVVGGGSSTALSFRATANPEVIEGPYPAVFVVMYQDFSGRIYTLNLTSTLIVKGLESIKLLSPQISPDVVANGSTITFSTTIVNEGKTPLRHAMAILESEAVYGKSTYYIGNIDPDSQVPVSLKALVRSDAPQGNYSVRISITYYDVFNELKTYEEVRYVSLIVNVTPTQAPPAFELPRLNVLVLFAVIAFVAFVTVFYLFWFKRKVGRSAEHS